MILNDVDIYYMAFPKAKWHIKAFVWTVYLLETAQTILATHDAFSALAIGWGQTDALLKPHLLWFSVPVMDGISTSTCLCTGHFDNQALAVSFIVQCFFSSRIYIVSGGEALVAVIILLVVRKIPLFAS